VRQIPYVNLSAQWHAERRDLLPLLEQTLSEGKYVGGKEIEEFETAIAHFCETGYAVALNSGTDALTFALHALGVTSGDEVITPPNSFIASTAAIVHVGAHPVFVDVRADQNIDTELIESAITGRTRAIMPVHLTGRMADMGEVIRIAEKHNLHIVEDAAQSVGSRWQGKLSGSMGSVGCFSTHPLKNLNACGDGGFITTNNERLAERIRSTRNHGLIGRNMASHFGVVSRMDTLQAKILSYRLEKLPSVIERRRRNAKMYQDLLDGSNVWFPLDKEVEFNTYHTFVIQIDHRDAVRDYLTAKGVETAIHYPVPIHLQPAAKSLGYKKGDFPVTENQASTILTLPVNQFLEDDDIVYVCDCVNQAVS
jgi:dTDP-4-amino-4,6-dideoxygalactose transaminase